MWRSFWSAFLGVRPTGVVVASAPLKNKLDDEHYLEVLEDWGTVADVKMLLAEIRRLRVENTKLSAELQALKS